VITNAIEITLVVILSLTGDFHDGLDRLEKKEYDKAVVQFTKVIDADPNVNDVRELSFAYRAQAYLGVGNKDKALEDLSVLIRTAETRAYRDKALAMYEEAGGDLKDLRPKESPEAVMAAFLAALQADDEKKARAHLSGSLLKLMETADAVYKEQARGRTFLMQMGREFRSAAFVSEGIDDTNQTARVTAGISGGTFTFGLEREDSRWTFSSLLEFAPEHRHHAMQHGSAQQQDLNKLRQLDAAVEQYTMANNGAPAKLAEAGEYVRDFNGTCVSSVDGKPFIFAIPKHGGKPWILTATATDGQRQGVINGSVTTMPEAAFKALARTQGVRLQQDWKQVEVTKDESGDIQALIVQLGAGSFRERKAAYAKLGAMGEKAGQLLQAATRNPDPEVALQARMLLDEL
jgi:tetratricopeptide (TPR) repeat protein